MFLFLFYQMVSFESLTLTEITKEVPIKANNNKVNSIETRLIFITDLLAESDLEKWMYSTLFN